jgi:acetate kinase
MKAAEEGNAAAQLAFDRFILYARRSVGAAAGVLGGVDAVIFTGGIGEHQPVVRRQIAAAIDGLQIDDTANAKAEEGEISASGSRTGAWVVHAREDLVLLRETRRLAGHR